MHKLSRWQYQYLGNKTLPRRLSSLELNTFFTFSPSNLADLATRYKPNLRIAAAIQLGFVRMTGRSLDALKIIPRELLQHIGAQLGVTAPSIATLKAIYRRRATLYEHQAWALKLADFVRPNDKQFAWLLDHLRKQSEHGLSVDHLVEAGKVWLYQHGFVYPGDRPIRDYARQALSESEQGLATLIANAIPEITRANWERQVLRLRKGSKQTILEWLAEPPRKGNRKAADDRIERVTYLKAMHVEQFKLANVPLSKSRFYGEQMWHMRPSKYRQLQEPTRTLRLICFLKWAQIENTDVAVLMCRRQVTQLWADKYKRAELLEAKEALSARDVLNEVFTMADNPELTDKQFRSAVKQLKSQQVPTIFPTRAAAARWLLTEPDVPIRRLLAQIEKLDVKWEEGAPGAATYSLVQALHEKGFTALPPKSPVKPAKGWRFITEGEDRERALRAMEAAALLDVTKGLRSGIAYIQESAAHRHRDEILISPTRWSKERKRWYAQLGLPLSADAFLEPLCDALQTKLKQVAEAVTAGAIRIGDDGVIHLPKVEAEIPLAEAAPLRDKLFADIGQVQLPELILEMDSCVGFSAMLLGRPVRSELELLQVYAGMLAQAAALDATVVQLQIPQLTVAQIRTGMQWLEESDRVRATNEAVCSYQRRLAVTSIWGDNRLASSDSMSVDVSRLLWNARLDPKRGIASVGTYTHLSDTGLLIYDQPLPLGNRQAGVAIEGVIRQEEISIERLCVDTHGYTAFGFTIAKLDGFDLCPRLKRLSERKLYVPRGMDVPDILEAIIHPTLSLRLTKKQWDDLVRITASIESGHTSAPIALSRYGSAATNDPIYRAGVALGYLLRSIYLCDYFINPEFRRLIHRILQQGEAVHQLQRAIYQGSFSKPRGQRAPELFALSGSLTLVSNLCLAWTTTKIQEVLDAKPDWLRNSSGNLWLKHVSTAHFGNINMRGILSFPLDAYRDRILGLAERTAHL